jgi:hypothetical protein
MSLGSEMLRAGIFQPDEITTVQAVFDEVIAEPWFDPSGDNPGRLAKAVIELCRRDRACREKLKQACEALARTRFSRTGLPIL